MLTPRFGVIDLETTGLSSDDDRIVQIGLVTVELTGQPTGQHSPGVNIIDEWSTRVRLGWPLRSVGPTDIHGLRRRHLLVAPSMRAALHELAARLPGSIPVAHNAAFDALFLMRAAGRAGVDLGVQRFLCTLRLSRSLDPGRTRSHALATLCQLYGIAHTRPHDALEDALATARLLPHLLGDAGALAEPGALDVLDALDVWVDPTALAADHQVR